MIIPCEQIDVIEDECGDVIQNFTKDDERLLRWRSTRIHRALKVIAGVMGNVLEWYDFAVFGFFSDVIGRVFFPKSESEDLSVIESFAVFGGAFLTRPVGGLIIGYIGDTHGRKKALEISIFLMATATTAMGCLPTYETMGNSAILLLLIVRMLQGLSVGGQLMSSLVFTLEGLPTTKNWGLYGSFVMAGANFGTLLGGIVAYIIRLKLTDDQLTTWGWRVPFLSGILICFCGFYLKYVCIEDEVIPAHEKNCDNMHNHLNNNPGIESPNEISENTDDNTFDVLQTTRPRLNPLQMAFSQENRRSLFASAMVPLIWSGGFYLSFVWLSIFMQDLIDPPVSNAFGVNSLNILLLILLFPLAGLLSDMIGRVKIMSIGAIAFGVVGPIAIVVIGNFGNTNIWIAICSQACLAVSLSMYGSPMCAWLVEAFDPRVRLTSVSIGYNIAQAVGGGASPLIATLLLDTIGINAPGILLFTMAAISFIGLRFIATPRHGYNLQTQEYLGDKSASVNEVELREIT